MSTEKNRFDDYLKEKLWRDIIFRMLVLFFITGITLSFATRTAGFSSLAYLEKTAKTIGPVLNTVGLGALFLAACALLFKDLEHQDDNWSQSTKRGKIGTVVRRLASDLMLWMLGIFGSMLCITVFATIDVWQQKGIGFVDTLQLGYIYGFFMLGIFVSAALNIFIRAPKAPLAAHNEWAKHIRTPMRTIGVYAGGMIAIIVFVYYAS
jgi:hypothetical protein